MKLTDCIRNKRVVLAALVATMALTATSQAQTQPGRAEVRAIRGSAVYSTPSTPAQPLKVNMVLPAGTTIKTGLDSGVDLFLGSSAGLIRIREQTTLALNTLTITDTGADTVVDVQLELPEGTILGNVNRLSAASKYEIKTPNGVAGIRGTRYRCSSTSFILLLDGSLVFVHVPPDGQPTPYTLTAPPPVYFSPIEGVKPAPPDLVKSFLEELGDLFDEKQEAARLRRRSPKDEEPFITPTIGAN